MESQEGNIYLHTHTYTSFSIFYLLMKKKTKNENFEQSHSAEIHKRGDPSGFLKLQFAAKYQKLEGGPFGDKTIRKKAAHCRNPRVEEETLQSRPVLYLTLKLNK